MWLACGFSKFIILDRIFFEGIVFLIPPEFVECFFTGRYVFYGSGIKDLDYVIVYVVDKVSGFGG